MGIDPPAVTIFPSAAITSVAPMGMVTLGWMSGLPAFADGENPAVLHADI